jgi:hypothetical protein
MLFSEIQYQIKKKYQALLKENKRLQAKLRELESEPGSVSSLHNTSRFKESLFDETCEFISNQQPDDKTPDDFVSGNKSINKLSPSNDKIAIFMSLFKGRSDVYAKRWQSKKGKSGYSPVCLNEWLPGVCHKPKVKCFKCNQKSYSPINESVVEKHLLGKTVIGIYPMCLDETCYFLAMDFDREGWKKDISIMRDTCIKFKIPVAIERSRSGNGGHVWFFFEDKISAFTARKFGTSLLTYSMGQRHEISFKSYDRLFPNQDTMPEGGFGNLIALPLQKSARGKDNSLFIDENFKPHGDQWKFLGEIQKLSEKALTLFITKLSKGNDLGTLKSEEASINKPWIKAIVPAGRWILN